MVDKKHKILVVDDEESVLVYLKEGLEIENYEVLTAKNGERAIELTKESNPDLIIVDIIMPKMNGYEMCKILKEKNNIRFLPIIMMTADRNTKGLVKGLGAGADEFIVKPFEIIEISARIKAMLRIKSLSDDLSEMNKNLETKVDDKTKEIQTMYMETVRALATAIYAKDSYTFSHCDDVAKNAVIIAKAMGLNQIEIEEIDRAAQLHDLGKISIPDEILRKTEKLTSKDWEEIKKHPSKSTEILKPLKFLSNVINIIEQHHEKYGGGGYPLGKKEKEIPLGARILAVADTYDAMLSDRPYRKALTKQKAIEELEKNSGTQFDPEVVNTFLKIIKK
ncbi:MAG: response regulator [Elusimicrobia bacterium]|nr:response regulator [Elusimicrobiota bacterium]